LFQALQIILCKNGILQQTISTQLTDFAARWWFWFSANDSSVGQLCPTLF